MNLVQTRRFTAVLLITAVVLSLIPSTLLQMNFNWPDILEEPANVILPEFHEQGAGLIYTWLAIAWVFALLILAIPMLEQLLMREDTPYLKAATFIGLAGSVFSMIGFLRWVFVVPHLADMYMNPAAFGTTQESVVASFEAVHRYGGNVIGEHLGQSFFSFWMMLVGAAMLKSPMFKAWVGWFGILGGVIYLLGQGLLFSFVIEDFPVLPEGGLIGSFVWLGWMLVVAVFLLRAKPE